MRLNRQESHIRISNVPPPGISRINWGKYVYFAILFLILASVLVYIVKSFLYIKGEGQVDFEKLYVQHTTDIRLIRIFVKEGDNVRKGAPLFSYVDERTDMGDAPSLSSMSDVQRERLRTRQSIGMKALDQKNHQENLAALKNDLELLRKKMASGRLSTDLERERLRTIQAIRLKEVESGGLREKLSVVKGEYDRMKKQVVLETYLPDRLNDLSARIVDTEQAIRKADEEIVVLGKYLSELEGLDTGERLLLDKIRLEEQALRTAREEAALLNQYGSQLGSMAAAGGVGQPTGQRTFLAPQDGVVTRIYLSDYEVALKGTTMMEIYQPEGTTIKGFFAQEYADNLRQGDSVKIRFPDGTTGYGVISRLFVATAPLPPEFQKKYEPVQRDIVVSIIPKTKEDALKWKSYFKMGVTLYIKRGF